MSEQKVWHLFSQSFQSSGWKVSQSNQKKSLNGKSILQVSYRAQCLLCYTQAYVGCKNTCFTSTVLGIQRTHDNTAISLIVHNFIKEFFMNTYGNLDRTWMTIHYSIKLLWKMLKIWRQDNLMMFSLDSLDKECLEGAWTLPHLVYCLTFHKLTLTLKK